VSTADSASRPVRPQSSTGSARRGSYADGGTAGGRVAERNEGGPMRRVAGGEASAATAPTTPVPVNRSAPRPATPPAAGPAPASSSGAGATAAGAAPRQAPRPAAARRVRLTVSRVDPWSAMKISFLLSVALGIAGVVMVFVLWTILAGMGVFDQINGIIGQVVQDGQQSFDIMDFIGLGRVVSLSIVIAVIDVILVTAISTLAAFLYNVSSALVGGVQLTLTDD
jgi:Transmembrane domain of unknown function (DUF3566)